MSIVSPESAPMTRSLPTHATADTDRTTGCNEIGDIENMLGSCAVSTHSGMGANDRCSGCSGNSDSCSTPRIRPINLPPTELPSHRPTSSDPRHFLTSGSISSSSSSSNTNVIHAHLNDEGPVDIPFPPGDFYLSPSVVESEVPLVFLGKGVYQAPLVGMLEMVLQNGEKECLGNDGESEVKRERRRRGAVSYVVEERSAAVAVGHPYYDRLQRLLKASDTGHEGEVENSSGHGGVTVRYRFFYKYHEPPRSDTRTELASTTKEEVFIGRMDLENVRELLYLDQRDTQYFICGPRSFVLDIKTKLLNMGVEAGRVHMEMFAAGPA